MEKNIIELSSVKELRNISVSIIENAINNAKKGIKTSIKSAKNLAINNKDTFIIPITETHLKDNRTIVVGYHAYFGATDKLNVFKNTLVVGIDNEDNVINDNEMKQLEKENRLIIR